MLLDSVGNSKTFQGLTDEAEVKRFMSLLSEEVFERLETVHEKHGRVPTKLTASLHRSRGAVSRKGTVVTVTGGKGNAASRTGAATALSQGQPALAAAAWRLTAPLLEWARSSNPDGKFSVTSLGLIASAFEESERQAHKITSFFHRPKDGAGPAHPADRPSADQPGQQAMGPDRLALASLRGTPAERSAQEPGLQRCSETLEARWVTEQPLTAETVDMTILSQLPTELQVDIRKQLKRGSGLRGRADDRGPKRSRILKSLSGAADNSSRPRSRQQQLGDMKPVPRLGAARLSSGHGTLTAGDIDPATLAALPADIRAEVEQHFNSQRSASSTMAPRRSSTLGEEIPQARRGSRRGPSRDSNQPKLSFGGRAGSKLGSWVERPNGPR